MHLKPYLTLPRRALVMDTKITASISDSYSLCPKSTDAWQAFSTIKDQSEVKGFVTNAVLRQLLSIDECYKLGLKSFDRHSFIEKLIY